MTHETDLHKFLGLEPDHFDKIDFMKKNMDYPKVLNMSHRSSCPQNINQGRKNERLKTNSNFIPQLENSNFIETTESNNQGKNIQFPPRTSIGNSKNTPRNDKKQKPSFNSQKTQDEKTDNKNNNFKRYLFNSVNHDLNRESPCHNPSSRKSIGYVSKSSISMLSVPRTPKDDPDNREMYMPKNQKGKLAIDQTGRDRKIKNVQQIDIDQVRKSRKFPDSIFKGNSQPFQSTHSIQTFKFE